MRVLPMKNIETKSLRPGLAGVASLGLGSGARDNPAAAAAPLLSVLLRRWRTFALTVLACLAGAALFLAVAQRVYRAGATIFVQQNGARLFADGAPAADPPISDTYLQTQADVIRSTPVLLRALESVEYGKLRTFEGVAGNPVVWFARNPLSVEVVKRSDVINVSVDSPHPQEAVTLVDAVVRAYIAEQSQTTRKSADDMARVLERERETLVRQRAEAQAAMLAAQQKRGEPTFRDGKGNVVLGRLDALSTSLTAAEVATMDLRAQQEATLAAMGGPEELQAFVEGLQYRGRDNGDREYDELRSQLVQYESQLTAVNSIQRSNHPRVRAIQQTVDYLKKQIAAKEEAIAEAQLADISSRLDAAEQKESQIRKALEAARKRALDLSPGEAAYAKLESEVLEIEKRCDLLDRRLTELRVNSIDAGAFNVRVLQPAMVPDKPVKPNKALTLAAALLVGCVLGIGLATFREWQDARMRDPEDIPSLLGLPLIGIVPQINRSLSPADRGQVLRLDSRSPVAEAYRSIRTSLLLGNARSAKTILLASPASGEGKSTTAANLAIAFAEAGERTLLLDCDLRGPVQHLIFESLGTPHATAGTTGFSTVMPGDTKLQESIQSTRVPNLYLLPCGPVPRNPSEMLAGDRFKFLLKTLCEAFDRVVIDSPALEAVADGRILAAAADATVLVLRMNRSMQRSGVMAAGALSEVGANVIGVVANDAAAVSAYRIEGGPWQYASGRGHDAIAATGRAAHSAPRLPNNGEHLPFGSVAHFSSETIAIAEPNWPAERP